MPRDTLQIPSVLRFADSSFCLNALAIQRHACLQANGTPLRHLRRPSARRRCKRSSPCEPSVDACASLLRLLTALIFPANVREEPMRRLILARATVLLRADLRYIFCPSTLALPVLSGPSFLFLLTAVNWRTDDSLHHGANRHVRSRLEAAAGHHSRLFDGLHPVRYATSAFSTQTEHFLTSRQVMTRAFLVALSATTTS